nr:MAG TPA: hypothetical protein [Bacteriophage sp.]
MDSVNKILYIYYISFCTFRQHKVRNYTYLYNICTHMCNEVYETKRIRSKRRF